MFTAKEAAFAKPASIGVVGVYPGGTVSSALLAPGISLSCCVSMARPAATTPRKKRMRLSWCVAAGSIWSRKSEPTPLPPESGPPEEESVPSTQILPDASSAMPDGWASGEAPPRMSVAVTVPPEVSFSINRVPGPLPARASPGEAKRSGYAEQGYRSRGILRQQEAKDPARCDSGVRSPDQRGSVGTQARDSPGSFGHGLAAVTWPLLSTAMLSGREATERPELQLKAGDRHCSLPVPR